jgi:menaquinone-dependent protoporphyrinogen oxidase
VSTISICYGTTDGQTADVAEFIAGVVRRLGHRARVIDLKAPNADALTHDALTGADAVLVGASIHVNAHESYVVDFVRANVAALTSLPTAFFSVSLSAYGDPAQGDRYIEEFCAETGWRPTGTLAVAGALRYTSYGILKRQLMKQIARDKGLSTDTRTDAVYTDWDAVTAFTEQFVAEVLPVSA